MKSLFNKLMPDCIKNDTIAYSYAKNLFGITLIACIAAPTYALFYYYMHLYLAAFVIFCLGCIILSAALLFPLHGSLFLTREWILVSLFLVISWLSYHLGGLSSATTFWLIMPPLIAIFSGGIMDGLVWSLICVITILIFSGLEYYGVSLPTFLLPNPTLLQTTSLIGLILVILGLVYFFETERREATQEVLSINKKLCLAKEEAENSAEKAKTANHLKTEFLANMSHELRTPLNGIIGFTELIYSGKAGSVSQEQQEYLKDVLSSAQHLLQLINDILDLSKIEAGKMTFHPEPVNLHQISAQVKEALSTLIKEKHIEFISDIDPSLRHIVIDQRKLKQVIYNYLSNAIKFTGEGGRIKLQIHSFGIDYFKLEVTDTGIGIRDSDLKKLFVEFQQIDSGFSKKYQGTGLGLALTQHIVEAQGGAVGVESILGKGSTFFAILPCVPLNEK